MIFSTKDRKPTCRDAWRPHLFEYMAGIARREFGQAICIGGTADHVHALVSTTTNVSMAEAMRKFKGLSSKWVHKRYPAEREFAWQSGYAAFSVSRSNSETVARYIAGQPDHHKQLSFEEEFLAFLQRHGVDYDPAHVWD